MILFLIPQEHLAKIYIAQLILSIAFLIFVYLTLQQDAKNGSSAGETGTTKESL